MNSFFYETQIVQNGELVLQNLPFITGDKVDVFLLKHDKTNNYSLRGTKFKLTNPSEPVAEDDWQVLQ